MQNLPHSEKGHAIPLAWEQTSSSEADCYMLGALHQAMCWCATPGIIQLAEQVRQPFGSRLMRESTNLGLAAYTFGVQVGYAMET